MDTNDTTEPMTEARFFEECLAAFTKANPTTKSPLRMTAERKPERDTETAVSFRCTWSGAYCALGHNYTIGRGFKDAERLPNAAEVLPCLFLDSESINDYEDWVSWAEEFGFFESNKNKETGAQRVERIRQLENMFRSCQEALSFLENVFGAEYDRLAAMAREL